LKASFVPQKPIRTLRNLTRYRKAQIQERQREANRLHKILEDTGTKLDCVATNILGASERAMLDALLAGTTDPAVLAELARGKLRKKLPALREALEGRFDVEHRTVVSAILAHIDFLGEQIDELSSAIEEQIRPFAAAVELLCTIPGVQQRTAEVIVAEVGADMSVFPSAGIWPPGGWPLPRQRRVGRQAPLRPNRKGSKWLSSELTEAAQANARSHDSYLSAQYRRLRSRRGRKRAIGVVKHSIIVASWHMLTTGEIYHDAGGDYFTQLDPTKQTRRLVARLERLGHTVTLQQAAA
jgi:transposase